MALRDAFFGTGHPNCHRTQFINTWFQDEAGWAFC
jgi:hypothetical protein